ncbi:14984_t:CDS:1, partial [Gigaspora rosea]
KEIFEKIGPYNKILDPKLWNNIILKFMARDQPIPFSILPTQSEPLPLRKDILN